MPGGRSPPQSNNSTNKAGTSNDNTVNDPEKERRKKKEELQQQITGVCECLESNGVNDLADVPTITELCELLEKLAVVSGLHVNSETQGQLNFECLMKLLEKHRYGVCNLAVCDKILDHLRQVSNRIKPGINHMEILKEQAYLLRTKADYEKSIQTAEELAKLAGALGHNKMEAEAYHVIVRNYIPKGLLRDALSNLKYLESTAESGDELCKCYVASARSLLSLIEQKNDEALKNCEECLGLARSLGNKKLECETLLNMGGIHCKLFNMQECLHFNSKARKIAEQMQFTRVIMLTEVNKSTVYSMMGKYEYSYKINKSLASKRDEYEDEAFNYAVVCNLSDTALILNSHQEALDLARESLIIAQKLGATGAIVSAHMSIGLAQEKMKNYPGAIESFQKCLEFRKQLHDDRIINNTFCSLGRAYEGKGEKGNARDNYEKALAAPRPPSTHWGDTEDFRFSPDYLLARMEVEAGNLLKAKEYLVQVVDRCESFRKNVQESSLKICFNDTQKKPYQLLQYILVAQDAKEEALLIGEKGRGRDFYDKVVKEGEQSSHLNTPQDLLTLAKNKNEAVLFLSQLEVVNKMCCWFITPDGSIRDVLLLPGDNWDRVLTTLDFAMLELRMQDGQEPIESRGIEEEEGIPNEPEEASKEGRKRGGNENECLASVNPVVSNFNLDSSRGPQKETSPSFSAVIEVLSELVVRPIEKHLEKLVEKSGEEKPKLLVIPQGRTFNVPYGALRLKNGEPLCSQISPHEIFSFHSYSHCLNASQGFETQLGNVEDILIVGNPTNNLDFAQKEAETIGGLLRVTPVIGTCATHTEVVKRLPRAPIIHFACHGNTDGRSLWLAPESDDSSGDTEENTESLLTVDDISKLTIQANMIVLSACHTARGKISSEGVLGLARAFLMAGAKSVVTALWAIPDKATEALMEKFYKNLLGGTPVVDALSEAMYQMQKEESFRNVEKWGAFKVLGVNVKVF